MKPYWEDKSSGITIYCGDCRTVMPTLSKAEMMFTDPPYGVEYTGGTKKQSALKGDETTDLYRDFLPIARTVVDGPCYMWFAGTQSYDVYSAVHESNYDIHSLILWVKNCAQMGNVGAHYKQKHEPCLYFKPHGSTLRWCGPNNEVTVWCVSREAQNLWHPTQKPVALAYRALKNHSAESVIDPFMGGGSTLVAAKMLHRRAVGIEINEQYCAATVRRLNQSMKPLV